MRSKKWHVCPMCGDEFESKDGDHVPSRKTGISAWVCYDCLGRKQCAKCNDWFEPDELHEGICFDCSLEEDQAAEDAELSRWYHSERK